MTPSSARPRPPRRRRGGLAMQPCGVRAFPGISPTLGGSCYMRRCRVGHAWLHGVGARWLRWWRRPLVLLVGVGRHAGPRPRWRRSSMRLCLAPRLPRRGGGPGGCGRGSRVRLCPTRQGRCWAWGPSLGCRWSTACAECGCCSGLRSCTASGCSVVPGSAGVRVVRSLGQARSFRQPVHSSTRVSGLSGSLPGLLVGLPPLLGLTRLAGSRLPSRRFDCVGVDD